MERNKRVLEGLYLAVKAQDPNSLSSMLKLSEPGLDLNACPAPHTMTLLHLAVGNDSLAMVDLLLNYGSDPNSLNCEERLSPLHLSVLYDHKDIVRRLIEAGGDPLLRDGDNKNSLDLVVENDLMHLLRHLTLDPDLTASLLCPTRFSPTEELKVRDSSVWQRQSAPVQEVIVKDPDLTHNFVCQPQPVPADEVKIKNPDLTHNLVCQTAPTEGVSLKVADADPTGNFVRKAAPPALEVKVTDLEIKASVASQMAPTEEVKVCLKGPDPDRTELESFFSCTSGGSGERVLALGQGQHKPCLASTSSSSTLSHISQVKGLSDYSYLLTEDETRYGAIEEVPSRRVKLLPKPTPSLIMTSPILAEFGYKASSPKVTTPVRVLGMKKEVATVTPKGSSKVKVPAPLTPTPTLTEVARLRVIAEEFGIILPVTSSTYGVVHKYIESQVKRGRVPHKVTLPPPNPEHAMPSPGFSPELQYALRNLEIVQSWGNQFATVNILSPGPNASPLRRASRSFFNYLLLDPKVIRRVNFSGDHLKSDIIRNAEKFETFLGALFYIGKGCGSRPLQHLVEAKAQMLRVKGKKLGSEKLDRIVEIWAGGQGVYVHSLFHHSNEREANVNEAAMIDSVGIQAVELTNLKKGSYAGTGASKWSQKVKNQYGTFLLFKAFCNFVVSEPKTFLPQDV